MQERVWNVRGFTYLLGALKQYKNRIKDKYFHSMKKNPQMFYIAIKVIFNKLSKDGNKTEDGGLFVEQCCLISWSNSCTPWKTVKIWQIPWYKIEKMYGTDENRWYLSQSLTNLIKYLYVYIDLKGKMGKTVFPLYMAKNRSRSNKLTFDWG